jgi:[methyl-Co(III) methanol-specific corrinoid protein]:coenzyme M methyltransferase
MIEMSDAFSPKERLLRVLSSQKVERPPVICPGGMMNSAIVDVMEKTGHELPAAHHDDSLMSALAFDVHTLTGFENFGIPFCMTVEAEVLGSEINYGTLECEPKIQKEKFPTAADIVFKEPKEFEKNNRVNAILNTIHTLSAKHPDVPTIGSLTGPISTAASIIDPMMFLKQLRKDKENSHRAVDYVTDCLIHFARLMVDSGVHVISIADPTATGEILGPKMFDEYAVYYLNKLVDAVHKMGVPAIVHICGRMEAVKPSVADLHSNALSVDAFVSLKKIMDEYPGINTMGNLSTILLEFSSPEKIMKTTELLLRNNIHIMAPACGLSTSTPLENINAFTDVVTNQ